MKFLDNIFVRGKVNSNTAPSDDGDMIRKIDLKNAVSLSNNGVVTTTGTGSAYIATVANLPSLSGIPSLGIDSPVIKITFHADSISNATLNINDFGARLLTYRNAIITSGSIKTGDILLLQYDSINSIFRIVGGLPVDVTSSLTTLQTTVSNHTNNLSDLNGVIYSVTQSIRGLDGRVDNIESKDLYYDGSLTDISSSLTNHENSIRGLTSYNKYALKDTNSKIGTIYISSKLYDMYRRTYTFNNPTAGNTIWNVFDDLKDHVSDYLIINYDISLIANANMSLKNITERNISCYKPYHNSDTDYFKAELQHTNSYNTGFMSSLDLDWKLPSTCSDRVVILTVDYIVYATK